MRSKIPVGSISVVLTDFRRPAAAAADPRAADADPALGPGGRGCPDTEADLSRVRTYPV